MIFGKVSTFYTILGVTSGDNYQTFSSFKKPTLQNMLTGMILHKHSMERRPWKPCSWSTNFMSFLLQDSS